MRQKWNRALPKLCSPIHLNWTLILILILTFIFIDWMIPAVVIAWFSKWPRQLQYFPISVSVSSRPSQCFPLPPPVSLKSLHDLKEAHTDETSIYCTHLKMHRDSKFTNNILLQSKCIQRFLVRVGKEPENACQLHFQQNRRKRKVLLKVNVISPYFESASDNVFLKKCTGVYKMIL